MGSEFVRKTWKEPIRSYAVITVACVLFALSFSIFYRPNDIAFGGVTGIAQMVNRLLGFPTVGVIIILINIPLFLLGWKFLGKKMFFGSLYAMFIGSVCLDLFSEWMVVPSLEEPLVACVFGGVFTGAAMGLLCREGASMGGTEIVARLLRIIDPSRSIGQILMVIDLIVICLVALVFKQLNSALLGIIALFVSTSVLDKVLFGANPSKVAYIISNQAEPMAAAIISELGRGVTMLNGAGAWTKEEKTVLLCAFKKRQIVDLKRKIQEIDPNAFLIVCEAYEVLGYGFGPHEEIKTKQKAVKKDEQGKIATKS